jgi:hypothetical protein
MESTHPYGEPEDARSALDTADRARRRLASGLRRPGWLLPGLALAVAAQVATAAWGIAQQTVTGLLVVVSGLAVFLVVGVVALRQFHRSNGVRIDGLTSQVVLGTGGTSTLAYVGAFAIATVAAFESLWWLVALASLAAGVGYALGVHHWWNAYRRDPATHASGPSLRFLAAFAVLAGLGVAVLVAAS